MASNSSQWPLHWSRPDFAPLNTRPATPSSGAYYKVLFPSPSGNGRRITAAQNSTGKAFFVVPWADRLQFEIDALGFSNYIPGQNRLNRRLPLRHGDPADTTLFLDSLETISFHNFDRATHQVLTGTDGPHSEGWPKTQMVAYAGTFSQTSYQVLEDTDSAVTGAAVPELKRYVTRVTETNAYHRKIPSYNIAFDGHLEERCPVLATLPEYTQRVIFTTYRWPVESVPEHIIATTLGTVNDAVFDPDTVLRKADGTILSGYPIEELLYEDCRKSVPYHGSDGTSTKLYVDLAHVFLFNPRNWNKQVRPATGEYTYVQFVDASSASYDPVRRPYTKSNFNRIFKPAGAPA